jgi:hypothetical protein
MKTVLLNISESNNNWNKSVLDMSWREREAARGFQPSKPAVEANVKPKTGPAQTSPDAKHSSGQ